jgi:N6-adenosine-specific RNA methylase IME4
MTNDLAEIQKYEKQTRALLIRLDEVKTAPQIIEIETKLDAIEGYMRAAGLFKPEQIRPVNEGRMLARWKLGQALKKVERDKGGRPGKNLSQAATGFRDFLKTIRLDKDDAQRAQRIGAMPKPELHKALAQFHETPDYASYSYLIKAARPYWYKENREQKHGDIKETAEAAAVPSIIGPFPLILADPPWKFAIYSPKGLDRTPDQHYPTLSDEEICNFKVGAQSVAEVAHKDAALFMWCTSSNLERALGIMRAWGFTFKSSAAWVKWKDNKPQTGMGLVFRNAHEVLLYGTRGSMPGPQYQPPSVFMYPRGRHSAKPPEIRAEIEKMYPDFSTETRLELFARETTKGWTPFGFEACRDAAE